MPCPECFKPSRAFSCRLRRSNQRFRLGASYRRPQDERSKTLHVDFKPSRRSGDRIATGDDSDYAWRGFLSNRSVAIVQRTMRHFTRNSRTRMN